MWQTRGGGKSGRKAPFQTARRVLSRFVVGDTTNKHRRARRPGNGPAEKGVKNHANGMNTPSQTSACRVRFHNP